MYSIVMVDDEPWALRDISNIIDWKRFGFDTVYCFRKPAEAIPVILREKPDVVLTDIRMAGITGIELIERCREACADTLFCLISAYADFQYAQQAIKNGVFSYILKPISADATQKLAEELTETLREKKHEANRKAIRTIALHALFDPESPYGTSEPDTLRDSVGGRYRIAVSRGEDDRADNCYRVYDDLYVTVLREGETLPEGGLFGISDEAVTVEKMADRMYGALTAYFTLRFYGRNENGHLYQNEDKMNDRTVNAVIEDLQKGKHIEAHMELSSYAQRAARERYSIVRLTSFYNTLLRYILYRYPESMSGTGMHEFRNCFTMYSTMRDADTFFASLHTLLDNCLSNGRKDFGDYSAIKPAVAYVDDHFRENVTLEYLSRQFNISLSYLCRCFKQETGVTFMEYLTNKRMDYACEMLKRTNLNVAEIGAMAGYSDYCYFTKVFKKKTGESPSTFRKDNSAK